MFYQTIAVLAFAWQMDFGVTFVVKVAKDISVHNAEYMDNLLVIMPCRHFECTYKCDKLTDGVATLRKYDEQQQRCECFVTSTEFRDSRHVSPNMTNQMTFLVNGEYPVCQCDHVEILVEGLVFLRNSPWNFHQRKPRFLSRNQKLHDHA